MTRAALRNAAVLVVGVALLTVVLYNATNVDAQSPRVASYSLTHHLAASDDVALTNSSIEVAFSEPVDHASAEAAFSIEPEVDGSFHWAGTTMSFTPIERLPLETDFEVRIGPGIRDAAGNRSGNASDALRFRTVGRPAVVASVPTDGGDVAALTPITLTFSTLMDTASVETALRITPSLRYDARWSGETLTIVPNEPLEPGERYELSIGRRASDLSGNRLLQEYRLRFSTGDETLETAWRMPAPGVAGISTATPIAVAFGRAIDEETLDDESFVIEPDVPGSLAVVDPEGADLLEGALPQSIVRFQPASPLPANTTFTVQLGGALRAVDGSLLEAPLEWTFTTGAPSGSLQNQVVFLTERSGVANLWAMNADGTNQRQLSAETSAVSGYDVSPDGSRFVVGDGARLVEYAADGRERRDLTEGDVLEFDASYRSDGSLLVFARSDARTGAPLGLWTREAGGGDVEQLELPSVASTPTPPTGPSASARPSGAPSGPLELDAIALLRAPRFSPDGRFIAYVEEGLAAVVAELATGRRVRVPLAATSTPAWALDSSAVIIAGTDPDDGERPLGGGDAVRPLRDEAADTSAGSQRLIRIATDTSLRWDEVATRAAVPVAGPGGQLAFVQLDAGVRDAAGAIVLMDASSADPTEILPSARFRASSVTFAPEPDELIAARAGRVTRTAFDSEGIWVLSVSGVAPVRLTRDGVMPHWVP